MRWRTFFQHWWLAITVGAVLIGIGAYFVVSLFQSPQQAWIAVPQLPWPQAVQAPKLNLGSLPATGPTSQHECPAPILAGKRGIWVAGYENDSTAPDLVSGQAKRLGLLDFFWTSIVNPSELVQTDPSTSEPSLDTELATAHGAKPCGLRFATISDNAPSLSEVQNTRMVAEILTNPAMQWRFVQTVAQWTASQPLLDGITLDIEYGLPQVESSNKMPDMATYERVAHWAGLAPYEQDRLPQEVDRLRTGYTNLVWALGAAMHRQHRLLRVAVLAQQSDYIDTTHIAPYVFNDGALASRADQLVLMEYDFHWSTGDPGPIAPYASVAQSVGYAFSYGMSASKIAIAVPAYAYDWQVGPKGHIAKDAAGNPIQAANLTPTQLADSWWLPHATKLLTPGGAYYTYAAGGQVHMVWDASAVLAPAINRLSALCHSCALMVWNTGNTDPVGWQEISKALG